MNHFDDVTAESRYQNELMEHMRKQTKALEQIAQLLQPKKEVKPKRQYKKKTERRG